jgi:hypothetical protein
MRKAFALPNWRRLILLGILSSWVGPILAWFFWPHLTTMSPEGDLLQGLVTMLWPMRILALGTTQLNTTDILLIVVANTVVYLFFGSLYIMSILRLGQSIFCSTLLILTAPIIWQLWGAGYDLKFVQWISFIISLMFYAAISLLATHIIKS